MIKYVPALTVIDDNSFPFDFKHWDYPEELLRSCLYSVWWTCIPENTNEELALVMDYDGFMEWYNSNMDKWLLDCDGDQKAVFTAEEYLPYHIGRTVSVVKIVPKDYID